MPPEALDGRRVLLVLIPEDAPAAAHFVAGPARWTGSELRVRYRPEHPDAVARGAPEALAGFAPAVLPTLLVPEHYPAVAALAAGVEACVAAFTTERPFGALTLSMPFFGLGRGAAGQVLLFQGRVEDDAGDDDDVTPSEAEPWEPDDQGT